MTARQRGFTLIEMLAATVLLAIVLGVLLPVFGHAMQALGRSEVQSRMAQVARSLIDEVSTGPLQAGVTEGERDGLAWRLECLVEPAQAGLALFRLRVTMRGDGQEQQFSTARLQRQGAGL